MIKNINKYLFFVCVFSIIALLFSLYLQFILGFEPCPMCISERIAVIGLIVVSFIALLHNPNKIYLVRVYILFIILIAVFGGYISFLQTYMYYFPTKEVSSCSFGFHNLDSVNDGVLNKLFVSNSSCSDMKAEFAGVSLALYTCLFFIIVLFVQIASFFKINKNHKVIK